MSKFKYILPQEQRLEYVNNRILELAFAGYRLEIDLKAVSDSGDEENIDNIKKQIDIIEKAINAYQQELN